MKHWPQVSIVILHWNTYDETRACLESLRQVSYPNHKIILVDNASTDGSGERLACEFPETDYVQNHDNMGFSRGCNAGIRRALAANADYVLLLNSDMVVAHGFLEPAVRMAEAEPRVGLVSGKIYLKDRPGVLWYAGGKVNVWRGVSVRGWHQTDEGQFDEAGEVGFATGAMMLIKRVVLEAVGLLPEVYFFGQEEWDYSLTVRRAGFKLGYVPDCIAYHKADGSHRNLDPKYLYNSYRNRLIFHEKFLAAPVFFVWMQVLRFYQRFIALRRLTHLDEPTRRAIPFAFRAALRDHKRARGGNVLEQDLNAFAEEYRRGSVES